MGRKLFSCNVRILRIVLGEDANWPSAIKTYNGEGASRQIKWHHCQIFSGREAPPILQDELPNIFQGRLDRPMCAQAIRVKLFEKGQSLDEKSA